jgi:hypothetical protein
MVGKGSGSKEKLCPVDKRACVRDRCMIYDEDTETCGWAKPVPEAKPAGKEKPAGKGKPKKGGTAPPSSQYRVHLFD